MTRRAALGYRTYLAIKAAVLLAHGVHPTELLSDIADLTFVWGDESQLN